MAAAVLDPQPLNRLTAAAREALEALPRLFPLTVSNQATARIQRAERVATADIKHMETIDGLGQQRQLPHQCQQTGIVVQR